jgi:hypothetical protein
VADTFFYSSSKDVVEVSERLHGKNGERTNELTFHLLDRARCDRSANLLCATLGYISHCVFDMIFHPLIYYLVGNYYDDDPAKRESAVYRHRLLETRLDSDVNNRYHLHNILKGNDSRLHDIIGIIAHRYDVGKEESVKAFKKQIKGNRCFRCPVTYRVIHILNRIGIIKYDQILPLFYGHLETDTLELEQSIDFRDIIDGRKRRESLPDMIDLARGEAIKRMNAAIAYYDGTMGQAAAMEVITGESLDTGREDCPVSRITHTV